MKYNYTNIEHKIIHEKILDETNRRQTNSNAKDEEVSNLVNINNPSSKSNEHFAEVQFHVNLMNQYLGQMCNKAENPAYRPIYLNNGLFGKIKRFIKKVQRKSFKWYIEPFTLQQTEFNHLVTSYLKTQNNNNIIIAQQMIKQSEILNQMSDINGKIEILEKKLTIIDTSFKNSINCNSNEISSANRAIKEQGIHLNLMKLFNDDFHKRVDDVVNKISVFHDEYQEELIVEKTINNNPYTSIYRSYSQSGEDIIVEYLLRILDVPMKSVKYIEAGATHPFLLSNTYAFYKKGARGVLIEANPVLIDELAAKRKEDIILNKALSNQDGVKLPFYICNYEGLSSLDKTWIDHCSIEDNSIKVDQTIEISTITLTSVSKDYFNGATPTIISLDIEGQEMTILESIDFDHYRPMIFIIETVNFNQKISPDKTYQTNSFMESKNYVPYAFTGINTIYLDRYLIAEVEMKL